MFGLNFTGLQKRDTYDEIVQIVESGGGKIKYPNRQATQILNSPYMKQINSESLMEIEEQQSNLMKEQMKGVILREISGMTGIPHFKLRAEARPHTTAIASVDADMAANEARDKEVENMRATIAEYQDAYHAVVQDKTELIARVVRQTHDQATETPMAHEMTMARIYKETQTHEPVEHAMVLANAGSQTSTDIKSRHTQTPTYREDEMRA